MTDDISAKQQPKWQLATICVLLIAVWLATPFMGDDIPSWVVTLYTGYTVVVAALGLFVAWHRRSIVLAVASVLTLFAWFIVLLIGLSLFGI
ncbi:MAG: hypothetical protein Q4A82_03480 [Corynebacterium sp.]|nr:hypothetical protein [Corynebacterium sp.]